MKRNISRRDWILWILRGGIAGGIAGGSAALLRRNGVDAGAHKCTGGGICSGCARYEGCVLPQAQSIRDYYRKEIGQTHG